MTALTTAATDAELEHAVARAQAGERLTPAEGLALLERADLLTLGSLADAARQRHNPGRVVTYIVDRNVNYTNVCVTYCAFCAFQRKPGHAESYVQTLEQMDARLAELDALGGRQVLLQGGHHPDLPIEWYEEMLRHFRARFPRINIHGFSPPEITHFSAIWGMDRKEILRRFIAAGLGSLPGGGAEILVDRVRRKIANLKATTDEWLGVMEDAHRLGLKTSATMMFGHVETLAERIEHLVRLREVQDRTGGFLAFACWNFQREGTPLGRTVPASTGATDYLRTVAVARLMVDNVPHVQASWVTQGPKIGQLSLAFGVDDFGGTMLEENVVSAAGTTFCLPWEQMEHLVRDAGYEPRRRTTGYLPADDGEAAR
ncbi:MAG: cyclic dehypoxanthinyl futalosine synthase [Planctomycetia bacterium]